VSSKKTDPKPPRIQNITIQLHSGREVTGRFIDGKLELDGPILTEEELTPDIVRTLWAFSQRLEEKLAAKGSEPDPGTVPPAPPSTGTGRRRAKRGES
jgi:hypothetical protein